MKRECKAKVHIRGEYFLGQCKRRASPRSNYCWQHKWVEQQIIKPEEG